MKKSMQLLKKYIKYGCLSLLQVPETELLATLKCLVELNTT